MHQLVIVSAIIWSLFCNVNIMRMALTKRCCGYFNKFSVLFQGLDIRAATVSHTGTDTTDQLEYSIFKCSLVCNTTFDTFRNKLLCTFLEIAVLASVLGIYEDSRACRL